MGLRVPKLCRRKDGRYYATDPATHRPVSFGRDVAEAERRYNAWLRERLAERAEAPQPAPRGCTVEQLVDAVLAWADGYYVKHGKPTSEVNCLERACVPLVKHYGTTPAASFGPTALKAVRDAMVGLGWARDHVNDQVGRVRRVFRWGVEHELIPPGVLEALRAVMPLRKGRSAAPEGEPVEAVPVDVVEATLPFCRGLVADMVRLQLWGAMRSQDVVAMRPCDIDRSREAWLYVPWTHKNEHREGSRRRIWLGPKCQKVLAPLLDWGGRPARWVFPSLGRGRHRGKGPGHLTVNGYRQAVESAVLRANADRQEKKLPPLPHWFPLQLRHTGLTLVRERLGLEAAQAVGGHAEANTTEIYAARLDALAREAARTLG